MDSAEKAQMRSNVLKMFYHGYDNYMRFAFPHDELKPLSASYTDSLAELGNAAPKEGSEYGSCLHSLTYCPLTCCSLQVSRCRYDSDRHIRHAGGGRQLH